MQMLSGVTIGCFFTSYLIALLLELTRPFIRVPGRMAVVIFFTLTGLATHVLYLLLAVRAGADSGLGLLSSWHEWALLVAWGLALCYLLLVCQRPEATIGYFLLPLVIALVVSAWGLRSRAPFPRQQAVGFWLQAHGYAMLMGTVAIFLGLALGLMFLVQSWRLKHKRLGKAGLRLPPLEWLQRGVRICLAIGTLSIAGGLCAGVIANLNRAGVVGWTEPGVLLSGVLFFWLVATSCIEIFYKPARQGQKVAYLSFAQFGFLALALIGVLSSSHGNRETNPNPPAESESLDAQPADVSPPAVEANS